MVIVSVASHFASVENNILSDIRNFHMKLIQAQVHNDTELEDPLTDSSQDQYLISSFVPERQRWSSEVCIMIHYHLTTTNVSLCRQTGQMTPSPLNPPGKHNILLTIQ